LTRGGCFGLGEAGGPKVKTFVSVDVAAGAVARAAVDLARSPKNEKLREEYDATIRGLLHVHGCAVGDANLEACKKHFLWHRNALGRRSRSCRCRRRMRATSVSQRAAPHRA
jgi:hypothetical protein